MAVAWTISGNVGSAWQTLTSLANRRVQNARLTFRSLEADTLEMTVSTDDITTATLPAIGDELVLWRDGVRFFRGTVVDLPITITNGLHAAKIVAAGPWWWMERINFTSSRTDQSGASANRISYGFPMQNLQVSIQEAIDQSITLGVPMTRGTVNAFFNVPQITLNQSTCGQALAELVRLVPDSMVWFDYSGTSAEINVTRRGVATARTINAASSPVVSISIAPMTELQVTRVRLPYTERNFKGETVYKEQNNGTGVTGKVQILTVSGPEIDTFLPVDLLETVRVKDATLMEAVNKIVPAANAYRAKYNVNEIETGATSFSTVNYWENGNGLTVTNYTNPGPSLSVAGDIFLFGASGLEAPPDWAIKQFGFKESIIKGGIWGVQSTTISGERRQAFNSIFESDTAVYWFNGGNYYKGRLLQDEYKVWVYDGAANPSLHTSGTTRSGTGTSGGVSVIQLSTSARAIDDYYNGLYISYRDSTNTKWCNAIVSDYDGATRTATLQGTIPVDQRPASGLSYFFTFGVNLYKTRDYDFVAPPANLAENLKDAQNWLPYQGDIVLVDEDVGGTRYRGTKIRISNSMTAYATMDALVSQETLDIETGTTTITLGQPPRLDYRTFVDRIRKTGQDNIVFV